MPITLYHHPMSRAASVVTVLEELELPWTLRHVDLQKGEQKSPEILALNPMGKLPILVDDGVVVTEGAAIAAYLADRYAAGRLAPALDDPARGTYLRWLFFAPSVIEPAAAARAAQWEYRPGTAGWGAFEAMVDAVEAAIGAGPWLLGERYTMADVVFGGTLRWLVRFNMIEARPAFTAYCERLSARPAWARADAFNQGRAAELGLGG